MKRIFIALAGLLLIVGLCALNRFIFANWFDTSYFAWYLSNGSLIGLTTSVVSLAWGDINRHVGLISAHPLHYWGSSLQLAGLPIYEMGTRLQGRRLDVDSLAASLVSVVLAAAIVLWVLVVVPIQYFVYLLCGAPGRTFHRARSRVAVHLEHGTRLEVRSLAPDGQLAEGWWEAGLGGKPVALTGIVTALFLTVLRWIF